MATSAAPLRRTRALVRLGGVLMILTAGAWAAYSGLTRPEQFARTPWWALPWGLVFAGFAGACAISEGLADRPLDRVRAGLLAVQAAAALFLVWLFPSFLITTLLVVAAWQIAWATPLRTALIATAAIAAGTVLLKCVDQTGEMSLMVLLATAAFQLFAVSAAHLARSEAAAREELARANAELKATHVLLTESARMSERLQISRDLHDVMGHHLTTLHLHLDVASRVADGQAAQHLACARDVAGTLLGEVRDVVARVRVQPVDLRETLVALTRDLAGLDVRLELPDDLSAMDPARADALLRCVQELITNTLRHARARALVVMIAQGVDGAVTLSAHDDGCGGTFVEGQGLAGMRERFEALGGRLAVSGAAGQGLRIEGAIPAAGAYP
jgi:signal transduction histidine kinase